MEKKILLTMPGCGGCSQVKDMLADRNELDEWEEWSLEDPGVTAFADALNIRRTPACIRRVEPGKYVRCDLEAELGLNDGRDEAETGAV